MTVATVDHRRDIALVVPTLGRPSLDVLLSSIAASGGAFASEIVIVDDRRDRERPLAADAPLSLAERIRVIESGGRGPAAARNRGWRATTAPWIVFLDDDVVVPEGWFETLADDLDGLPPQVAASQGRIRVPLPSDRLPTDWERNVAGLEHARWATADMAYRRAVLRRLGGFDERFPRAYREDADLGLRVERAGYDLVLGRRHILHPVRPAEFGVSLRMQAGNADDPFMRALHGRRWREAAGVPAGRRPWHLATVIAAASILVLLGCGRRRGAAAGASVFSALTADFTWRRIAPGPRTPDEIGRMVGTSLLLPFVAVWHWLRGVVSVPHRLRQPPTALLDRPAAVLFDRDGTLIHDEPYSGDPDAVRPVDGARAALDRLRSLGIPTGVITNQSGIGRGMLTVDEVARVNARVETLLGPLGPWEICPHAPQDGCRCRKPHPVLIQRACDRLGVDPRDCVMIGDIGADMQAAQAAGARGVLVPTDATRPEEIASAPIVARDLAEAVEVALRPGVGVGGGGI